MAVMRRLFGLAAILLLAPASAPAVHLYTDGVEVMVTATEMNAALARENGWRLVGSGSEVRVALKDVASSVDWVAAARTVDGILSGAEKLSDNELLAGDAVVDVLLREANETTPVPLARVALAQEALREERGRRGGEFGTPVAPIGATGIYLSITRHEDNFIPPGKPDAEELASRGERRLCLLLLFEDRASLEGLLVGDALEVRDPHGRVFEGGKLGDGLSPEPRLTGRRLRPGAREEGWVCRAVPKKLDLRDLAVRYRNGPHETRWLNLGR